jgi:hypothetical protein
VIVDATDGPVREAIASIAGGVVDAPLERPQRFRLPDAAADAVVGLWSAFRGVDAAEVAEVDRVLRPGGRQLVVHDYGRDDVARLLDEREEPVAWSHRMGPFLTRGFRVRVLHCWWTFDSLAAAAEFLVEAFGERGREVAESLRRPRLSYKVAVYHRSRAAA